MYDLDNVPKTENSAPALIEKAGITHNLHPSICLKDGDYKDKEKGKWHGFEVTLTDPDGLQLVELYFMPPQSEAETFDGIKLKKYELVEGKQVETRDQTKLEVMKTLNNEFMAFLIDLGGAFGFNEKDVQEHLYSVAKKGVGFIKLSQAFIDKFKPTENTRISAKLMYENSDKKQTSYLKAHGSYNVYFPYGNDLFDVYKEGRQTLLKLSQWEVKNKLVKKYTNQSDAPKDQTQGVIKDGSGFKPNTNIDGDDDPF